MQTTILSLERHLSKRIPRSVRLFSNIVEDSATRTARKLKANDDADIAEANARIRKAVAETKTIEAETDARIHETDARIHETDARIRKAVAETKTIEAETDARIHETDARIHETDARIRKAVAEKFYSQVIVLLPLLTCLIGITLTLDWLWHDQEDVIKFNMARKLQSSVRTSNKNMNDKLRLFSGQLPPQLSFVITMLLGPTGSGKSTMLKDLAQEFSSNNIPSFLISMRMPASKLGTVTMQNTDDETDLMDNIARQIFAQIGYPQRRSIIRGLMASPFAVYGGTSVFVPPSRGRLLQSLNYLFEVCENVAESRVALGISQMDAAPVLLFDEVEDLVKNSRLKQAGGDVVLNHLGTLLVRYSVDKKVIRSALAGSSAELAFAFSAPVKSSRCEYFYLADPTETALEEALVARGYSKADSQAMMQLCGTRLRLFNSALHHQIPPKLQSFLETATYSAQCDFRLLLKNSLSFDDSIKLIAVLDRCLRESERTDKYKEDVTTIPAMRSDLLFGRNIVDFSTILFVHHNTELFFQSQLHKRVWQRDRRLFV
jgi:hypothetical protein